MSLRRLVLSTLLGAFDGPVLPQWAHDLTVQGMGGHALFRSNITDPDQLTALCGAIHAARSDVLIAIDEEGGDVTRLGHRTGSPYPGNGALGAIDDAELTRAIYASIGADLARVGVDLDLAPTVDVNSTSANPVIGTRSFGADPTLVARHTAAAVIGLQGAGVAACAKHFPGHGATTADSHLELPTVDASLDLLAERDLPPFTAAASAGSLAIMTAHIRIPAVTGKAPATFSPAAIGILRERIGYSGVIVTDALEMQGAVRYAGGAAPGAVLALAAGADLLCIGSQVTPELVEDVVASVIQAIEDGRLPLARVEEAAGRVAALSAWVARARSEANGVRPATPELGLAAAKRAVKVEGTLTDLSAALVVQLETSTTIAEGRVPWGLSPHMTTNATKLVASTANADEVLALAGSNPIIVTGRNLHRLTGAPALINALAAAHDVVVLEMGWPSPWRPENAKAFVTTYGASNANGRAAAETLGVS